MGFLMQGILAKSLKLKNMFIYSYVTNDPDITRNIAFEYTCKTM
jgi:hypothetical protein